MKNSFDVVVLCYCVIGLTVLGNGLCTHRTTGSPSSSSSENDDGASSSSASDDGASSSSKSDDGDKNPVTDAGRIKLAKAFIRLVNDGYKIASADMRGWTTGPARVKLVKDGVEEWSAWRVTIFKIDEDVVLDRMPKVTGHSLSGKDVIIKDGNYCHNTIVFNNEVDAQLFYTLMSNYN